MSIKTPTSILLAVALAASAGALFAAFEQTVTLALPAGDPGAGRQAFVALGCTSCHRVVGDREMPLPVSAHPGPFLGGRQAVQDVGRLASSIIAPSHEIRPEALPLMEGELSPMGDYSHAMTVRQLVDLVAYLKSLEREGAS